MGPVLWGPPEVRGGIILGGRIVTVIDMPGGFGLLRDPNTSSESMGVTVESGRDFYTLLVDRVGDVINLPAHQREPNRTTLDRLWLEFADGVFVLQDKLMVVLDAERLLQIRHRD